MCCGTNQHSSDEGGLVAKMLRLFKPTMSFGQQSQTSQTAQQAPTFDAGAIRSVLNQAGQPMLAILEGILFVKPEWSYSQAHAHWHAFCAKLQLPPATKAHMPKRLCDINVRSVPPMLATEVPTLANVFMSLPESCPQHLCECAAALYTHYNMESPPGFVYEPIVASASRKVSQNQQQTLVAVVPSQSVDLAPPTTVSAIVPQTQPGNAIIASQTANVSVALAATMPQNAVAQIGRVFQNNTFCLRALQDVHGTLWFKGNEVAEMLGYAAPAKAICDHVHKDRRQKLQNLQLSSLTESVMMTKYEQEATWVNEPGLWQLLGVSQTELGQQFRLWFSGEVMPQLVRTGSYNMQPQLPTTSHDELQALQFEQLAAQAAAERQREAHLRVQTKLLRIELALKAKQAAQELGLNTNQALDVAAQLAIDAAALPPNLSDEGFTDAGEYLRMRGHSESEVRSLQVTFGLMLKKHYQQVHGVAPPGHFHAEFGGVVKTPYSYNRQADRELLNGTYQMLTLTDTYRKQVPNALLALNSVA